MRFFRKTSIDFMGKRKMWYSISLTIILLGIVSLSLKGFLDQPGILDRNRGLVGKR